VRSVTRRGFASILLGALCAPLAGLLGSRRQAALASFDEWFRKTYLSPPASKRFAEGGIVKSRLIYVKATRTIEERFIPVEEAWTRLGEAGSRRPWS